MSKKKNLSVFEPFRLAGAEQVHIGILVSEWNPAITTALLNGAMKVLSDYGISREHILLHRVPGSFELVAGAAMMAETFNCQAIICLGCIIQGETRHFEFIAQAVASGIAEVGIRYKMPVIFGVLTTDTYEQALARAGGKHGNKGDEAAITALKMVELSQKLSWGDNDR